jgi:hypothetical protein
MLQMPVSKLLNQGEDSGALGQSAILLTTAQSAFGSGLDKDQESHPR